MQREFPAQCDKLYGERLYQLRKYVLEMFLNLKRNEVLKELRGNPQLQELRTRKIEEIVKDALEGEKQRQVQLLVQRISQLSLQIGKFQAEQAQSIPISSQQREIDRIREECQSKLEQQQKRHDRQTKMLQKHFRQLLRSALSNYERHLTRPTNNCRTHSEPNPQHELTALSRQLQQKDQIIEELTIRMDNLRKDFEQVAQRMVEIECENKCLLDSITVRAQKSLMLEEMIKKHHIRSGEESIEQLETTMSDGCGANAVERELEEFKLREKVEGKLYQQHKNYSEKVTLLRTEQRKSKHRQPHRRQKSPGIKDCSQPSTNQDTFGVIQRDFERDLNRLKRTLNKNGTILRPVQLAE